MVTQMRPMHYFCTALRKNVHRQTSSNRRTVKDTIFQSESRRAARRFQRLPVNPMQHFSCDIYYKPYQLHRLRRHVSSSKYYHNTIECTSYRVDDKVHILEIGWYRVNKVCSKSIKYQVLK